MDYINIASKGNSIYFGDFQLHLVVLVMVLEMNIRGIFSLDTPGRIYQLYNHCIRGKYGLVLVMLTFNTDGQQVDMRQIQLVLRMVTTVHGEMRIEYVEIHTIGNATDFGDLKRELKEQVFHHQ